METVFVCLSAGMIEARVYTDKRSFCLAQHLEALLRPGSGIMTLGKLILEWISACAQLEYVRYIKEGDRVVGTEDCKQCPVAQMSLRDEVPL